MKKKDIKMGPNRTGLTASPAMAEKMTHKEDFGAPKDLSNVQATEWRKEHIRNADPAGSIPLPATLKGSLSALGRKLSGENIAVLLDKLGERLAFERTGTRLYELMIAKAEAESGADWENALPILEKIRDEELQHFQLLAQWIEELGADPTSMTPAANVAAVESAGLLAVIGDPRLSFLQSLEALRTAELVDNDAWDVLIELAEHFGLEQMDALRECKAQEERHLEDIRRLSKAGLSVAAGMEKPSQEKRRAS